MTSTTRYNAQVPAGARWLAWTLALLLPLSWSAAGENFYGAGGRVDYLDIDGPIRRLLHPENRTDGQRFDSTEKAAELVDALRIHLAAHPETTFNLIVNSERGGQESIEQVRGAATDPAAEGVSSEATGTASPVRVIESVAYGQEAPKLRY